MLRLCVLIPGFSDGGAQKQCIFLLNALQECDDVELTLIRFRDGVHDPLLRRERIAIHTLPYSSNADPRLPLAIAAILRRSRAQILLTWLISCDLHGFFVRACAGNGVRWVMTERNSRHPKGLRFRLRYQLGRFADAVISNSPAGDAAWARLARPERRFVVPNIVLPALTASEHHGAVLFAGRLEPAKNPIAAAAAFLHLAARRADLHFQIVGQGSLSETLRRMIAGSPQAGRIVMTGFRDDLPVHLAGAKALVSLSHHEGLPNVLLEAAMAGIPIVASAIPEHVALLGAHYPYLVAPDAPPAAIAAMIETAIDDPAPADALAPARQAMTAMAPEAIAARYMAIFAQVAGGRAA